MAIRNKAEIEIFYKTHNLSTKEVAEHFKIPYRTLAHWIKKEQWQSGESIKNIDENNNRVVLKNSSKVIDIAQVKIKEQIKTNLGECAYKVDDVVLNNLLESSTDEILLKTMSLNFIQKNIALCAILAKDHLLRLASSTTNPQNSPIVIACAEKVAKIYTDMKTNIYGRDNLLLSNNDNTEYEKLSIAELNMLLEKEEMK